MSSSVSQSEALQAVRHRSAEEARGRQELDGYRQQSMEQLRGEVLDREEQLRALSLQLDRGCREGQLYRQRSAKDIQQVGPLHPAVSTTTKSCIRDSVSGLGTRP